MCKSSISLADRISKLILPLILFASVGDAVIAATAGDTGGGGVHLGPMIRGFIYLLAMAALTFRIRWGWPTLVAVILVILISGMALVRGVMWGWDPLLLISEVQWLFRVTFGPIVLLAILDAVRRGVVSSSSIMRITVWLVVIVSLLVIVPSLLSFGRQTYSWGIGNTGLLIGQNETGLALAVAIPPLLWLGFTRSKVMLVPYAFACFASTMLGTRFGLVAPALLTCGTVIVLLRGQFSFKSSGHGNSAILSWWLGGVAQLILVIAAVGVTVYLANASPHQFRKLERMLNGDVNRGAIAEPAIQELMSSPDLLWSVGPGRASVQYGLAQRMNSEDELRAIEVDWIDLAAGIGAPAAMFVGALILTTMGIWCAVWIASGSMLLGIGLLSAGAYMTHAVLAGHAIGSVIPSTMLALVIGWMVSRLRAPWSRVSWESGAVRVRNRCLGDAQLSCTYGYEVRRA